MKTHLIPENIKIPENFIIVLTKMMPDIKNITPKDVTSVSYLNPLVLQKNEGYIIFVEIKVTNNRNIMDRDHYSDEITKLFHATYPDYRFVKFAVVSISVEWEPTIEDKFKMLFCENSK